MVKGEPSQEMRRCRDCGEEKPLTAAYFHPRQGGRYFYTTCRPCTQARLRNAYAATHDVRPRAKNLTPEQRLQSSREGMRRLRAARRAAIAPRYPIAPAGEPMLTVAQAAARLGVTPQAVNKWIAAGRLQSYLPGPEVALRGVRRCRVVLAAALADWQPRRYRRPR